MAHDQKTLTTYAAAWSEAANHWIGQALQTATVKDIQHQTENEGAALFLVEYGGSVCGAFVLRIDHAPSGPQGVIVAAAAAVGGVDMTAQILPSIEARFMGCSAIRFHTTQTAVARKLRARGYQSSEIVCIKKT